MNVAEGIHSIELAVSDSFSCRLGDVGSQTGPGLAAAQKQTLEPDSNGKVVTSTFMIETVLIGPFPCEAGYTLFGADTRIEGRGEDYFNGVTKGFVAFVVK